MFIRVQQSLFLVQEQRNNEGSLNLFFSKGMIILIAGDLYVPFLLGLKSKNIHINKDYWILVDSDMTLTQLQCIRVEEGKDVSDFLSSWCPSLQVIPFALIHYLMVIQPLMWSLHRSLRSAVSRTKSPKFSCLQNFVCHVCLGRNTLLATSHFPLELNLNVIFSWEASWLIVTMNFHLALYRK